MSTRPKRHLKVFIAGILALGCGGAISHTATPCTVTFQVVPLDPDSNTFWVGMAPRDPEIVLVVDPRLATKVAGPNTQGRYTYTVVLPLQENAAYDGFLEERDSSDSAVRSVDQPDITYSGQTSYDAGFIDLDAQP